MQQCTGATADGSSSAVVGRDIATDGLWIQPPYTLIFTCQLCHVFLQSSGDSSSISDCWESSNSEQITYVSSAIIVPDLMRCVWLDIG